MDIMTGQKLSFAFIGIAFYPVRARRGVGVKEGDGGDCYVSPLQSSLQNRT